MPHCREKPSSFRYSFGQDPGRRCIAPRATGILRAHFKGSPQRYPKHILLFIMGCTSSKEEWQDQTPGRRVTRTQFDYRNPGAAGSKLRPEPSIYGDAFQTYAAGRSTTFHERIRPQDVEPKTYKRRPAEFTNEMEKEYGWYKELAKQNRKYRDGYAAKCQRLGGLQKMTEEEHHEMQMMCEGKVDETTEDRIRASPMLHGHNQLVFSLPVRRAPA